VRTASVAPERPKAVGRELGVTHGMHDVAVPKVGLDGPRVDTVVRQVVARRVSQHVRVSRELRPGAAAGSRNHLSHCRFGDWTTAFGDEHERRFRVSAFELP